MHTVLVTRPEPGASETAARLEALGHQAIKAPFLIVERTSPRLPRNAAACLITSASAAWAIPPNLPVYAVGDATAAKARAFTTAKIQSAHGDAAALADLITGSLSPADGPLLLLSGERQGLPLAKNLRAQGFRVLRRTAYRARPPAEFPQAAQDAIAGGEIDTILFFSAETATSFARLLPTELKSALARINAFAISPATATTLQQFPWRTLASAQHPNQEEVLRLIG